MRTDPSPAHAPASRARLARRLFLVTFLAAAPLAADPSRSAFADPLFAPAVNFSSGLHPTSVATGDFNADGRLDLAVTNNYSNTVSVFLGNGDGTLAARTDYGTGSGPWSVATGDMNGDGRVDLIVANNGEGSVSVLLGTGTGAFGTRTDFATGAGPWSVEAGDLNLDGRLDVAVANANANTVSVLLGGGDGSLAPRSDYPVEGIPTGVAIGDLDRDGRPDLAVVNYGSDTVSILRGMGDGTFAGGTSYGAQSGPLSLAIADLNEDGRPDLAVGNYKISVVSVLQGADDGSYNTLMAVCGTDRSPYSVAVADLNADGHADLATANWMFGTASVVLGNGNGSFAAKQDYATGPAAFHIAAGDLNGDLRLDLIVANSDGNTISVLRNIGPYPSIHAPVVAAPASVLGTEGEPLQVVATASDPDGDPIASLTATPLPRGATFTENATHTSGTMAWTPDYTQAGRYTVTFTAWNTLGGTASTAMQVADVYDPPVVSGPASVGGTEGIPVAFAVTVNDPDGQPISSLAAAPLPTGAAFDVGPMNASGTFHWTPDFDQAGTYSVTISAQSARRPGGVSGPVIYLTGTLLVELSVANADRPPVLTVPGSQAATEGVALSFAVQASDPDGQSIASLTAAPLPTGASFTPGAGNSSGTFAWTPAFGQAGSYSITFTASNALSAHAVVPIEVSRSNRPPVLSAPGGVYASEGALVSFTVGAFDPDGDHVTMGVLGIPVGATFVDLGNNSSNFVWTPGYGQAGIFEVVFTGRDDGGLQAEPREVVLTVSNVNRAPVADPRGPYTGIIGVPVLFDGTSSSDPDGDALTYTWQFGDGTAGSGELAYHAYSAGGAFVVTLRVDDGLFADDASTSAVVQDVFPARSFTTAANATIRLGSGKATWCLQLEPVDGSYLNTAVLSATIAMKYGGEQILALPGKVTIGSDRDANGIQEITACFAKADLRTLFAGLPRGTSTVTVTLEGNLSTGGRLRGELTVDVVNTGGALAASVSPNPLNPQATLTFHTSVAGRVSVSIFDTQGHRVRTLWDGRDLPAGYHDIAVDGRSDAGARLASGIYFCRIEAPEGSVGVRFAILK